MTKYLFSYHGGGMPETPEEQAKVMAAWESWIGANSSSMTDPGAPFGVTKTVNARGDVTDGGGANPVTGFGIVEVESIDAALEIAKGCPILDSGGSVEVGEAMDM